MTNDLRVCAQLQLAVALAMIERRDPAARELASAALDTPSAATLTALLDAGRSAGWRPMLLEALAQVAIAAAEDILGDGNG